MIFYRPILGIALFLVLSIGVSAQCVDTADDPCVSVRTSTLDKAAKAVSELVEARKLIDAFARERTFTDNERKAWLGFKDAADATVAMLQKGIVDREKIVELQQKVIDKLMALNDKLLAQLDKKPSLWSKFVNVLKTAVLLITGAAISRGAM